MATVNLSLIADNENKYIEKFSAGEIGIVVSTTQSEAYVLGKCFLRLAHGFIILGEKPFFNYIDKNTYVGRLLNVGEEVKITA